MTNYAGIDVSKLKLDVFCDGIEFQVDNSETGFKQLIKKLVALNVDLTLCEATGGYEKALVLYLRKHNNFIRVIQPNKIRSFTKSKGIRAKTDKIDARMIYEYAKSFQITNQTVILSEDAETIKDLTKRREQLQKDKYAEHNRLDKISNKEIQSSIQKHIQWLEEAITDIDSQLNQCAAESAAIKKTIALLKSVPCIGDIAALYLVAYLPELGLYSHKSIAALVGVAPYSRDSGQHSGQRYIQGGRSALRKILYMSSLSAIRYNPELRAFYQRLRAAGKPAKLALTAVIRKLTSILNSIMKRQTPWTEKMTYTT